MKKKEKFDDNLEPVAVPGGRKKKKKVWIIIVLIAVVVIAAVAVSRMKNTAVQTGMVSNQVEIEPVQKRDLSDAISLKGSISGASKVNVTSKALAEITAMNVQVGDIVKEGDVLCTLDSASIEEQISELEKTLSNASAVDNINSKQTKEALAQAKEDQATALEAAQEEINNAQDTYNGTQILFDKGETDFTALLGAKRALESAQKNYESVLESTNRAIESAQTAVDLDRYKNADSSSRDTLKSLKEQLEDCEIKAPCGGVVTAVNVSVGDVNAEKVTILTIEDTSSLKMVATVAEADILKIEEGMKAVVTADATGDEEINGKVTRVVRVKDQSGSGSDGQAGGYSVELSVDNTQLLIGMTAKAKVMIQEKGEVLAVPYDLINYDESGNAYVLIAKKDESGNATAVRKDIEAGEEVDYYTEITGGDLAEGDLLIYDYSHSVTEGQTFTPEQIYSLEETGLTDEAGAEVIE